MYTHTIRRLPYGPIFFIMFVSGICAGSIIGLASALINPASVGLFGGTFIALLAGLTFGFLALLSTAVFNTLAPAIGGVALEITQLPEAPQDDITIPSSDSPSH